jgi:hypothetical protein
MQFSLRASCTVAQPPDEGCLVRMHLFGRQTSSLQ